MMDASIGIMGNHRGSSPNHGPSDAMYLQKKRTNRTVFIPKKELLIPISEYFSFNPT